jgi:hypothetical protein
MYADQNGNVYKYNPSSGAQQYTTSGGWQAASKSATASAAQNDQAQSVGAQRYDNYRRSGGRR